MSQVTIRCPLVELNLRDQLRSEPDALFHLFLGQRPLYAFFLRQVNEGTSIRFQTILIGPQLRGEGGAQNHYAP